MNKKWEKFHVPLPSSVPAFKVIFVYQKYPRSDESRDNFSSRVFTTQGVKMHLSALKQPFGLYKSNMIFLHTL